MFRALLAWLAAHVTLGLTIWALSPGAETVWFHVGRWLRGIQDSDSWKPIEIAFAASRRGDIYQHVFFDQGVKFQYPLTTLTLFGGVSRAELNVLSWGATLLTAVVSALLLGRSAGPVTGTSDADTARAAWARTCLAALAGLTWYPLMKAYSLGQVQTCVTALCALVLLAWQRKRPGLAGAALGLALLVKPTTAPLVLWGIVRREWQFTIAALGTATAGLIVALLQYPLAEHVAYARVLSYIGARGELFYANQSLNGLLNRWVAHDSSLQWQPSAFAEPTRWIAFATTAGFVLLVAASLVLVRRAARGTVIDLAVVMLASTIGAPVAWEHHYGVLVPIVAAVSPAIVAAAPFGSATSPLLFASALVAANFFQVAHRFDRTWLNPLQSYLLFAALMLWLMILATSRRCAAQLPRPA
jgi:hypothetical protein